MKFDESSIFQMLYSGQFYPAEILTINNPLYREKSENASRSAEALLNQLNDEQRKLFEEALADEMEAETELMVRAFAVGVRFAFELIDESRQIPLGSLDHIKLFNKLEQD